MEERQTRLGDPDPAIVRRDGTSLQPTIDGVKTRTPKNHLDHRGGVFEIFEGVDNEYWDAPIVYAHQFSIRPGQVKGWGIHDTRADRCTLITGEVLVVLYDARFESTSAGVAQKVVLSERGGARQLTIPSGVWHTHINVGRDEAVLVNFPTEAYRYEGPDRRTLPWNTDQIPVDIPALLPKF